MIDVIHQLMAILSHETTTVFAMHTSLRFTRSSQRLLTGSHTVVRIVTPTPAAEEAKRLDERHQVCEAQVQVRGSRDEAQA